MSMPIFHLRRITQSATVVLCAVALSLFGVGASAQAPPAAPTAPAGQTPPPAPAEAHPIEMSLTPYLWFSGLHGTVGAKGLTTDVNASFSDIWDKFNIGGAVFLDTHQGREVAVIDTVYMKLTDENDTPGKGFSSVKTTSETLIFAPELGWRIRQDERSFVDVLGGIRLWYLKNSLDFRAGALPGQSGTKTKTWVDPIIGMRGRQAVDRHWYGTLAGDIGGFGAGSKFAWQLVGLVGYTLNTSTSVQLAYRYLDTDYRKDDFVFDVHMDGLILGVTFKL